MASDAKSSGITANGIENETITQVDTALDGVTAAVKDDIDANADISGFTNVSVYGPQVDASLAQRIKQRTKGAFSEADEATSRTWKGLQTYEDLLQLNRAFLQGEEEISSYHLGPIYNETRPLVPGLLRLHDYGLLTYCSQPASIEFAREKCPCCKEWAFKCYQQRAFVSFILPTQSAHYSLASTTDAFKKALLENKDLMVSIYDGTIGCSRPYPDAWVTMLVKKVSTSPTLLSLRHTLTPLQAETMEGLVDATPLPQSAIRHGESVTDVLHIDPKLAETLKALVIHVAAESPSEMGLLSIIEQTAVKAGMAPVYAAEKDEDVFGVQKW